MPSMRRAGMAMTTPTARPVIAPTGNISGHGRSQLIVIQHVV
jgi:hypothetical protein